MLPHHFFVPVSPAFLRRASSERCELHLFFDNHLPVVALSFQGDNLMTFGLHRPGDIVGGLPVVEKDP